MPVLDLPTFTESAPQVGPRLNFDVIELNSEMKYSPNVISQKLIEDPNWIFFTRKGNSITSPILVLRAAEELGLFQTTETGDHPTLNVNDIMEIVNETLNSTQKKSISIGSILSNLNKATTYVQKAFGICLILNRALGTITVANSIDTEKNLNKHIEKSIRPLRAAAKQVDHALTMNYKINFLTEKQQEACKLLAGSL